MAGWLRRRRRRPEPENYCGDRKPLHDGDQVMLPGYRRAVEVLAEPTRELRPVPPPIAWPRPGRRRGR